MIEQGKDNKSKTLVDSYKEFEKSGDNIYNVDKETYRTICIDFNEMLIEYIILDAGEISLPCRLGTLRIKKIKSKNRKMVDWKLTKEYGKLIGKEKDIVKMANFKLSVTSKDVSKDLKGPQIGKAIKTKEKNGSTN